MATEDWRAWLIEWFARDHGPMAELIANGDLQLAADNTHDLPTVPTWHRDSMVIIGDAAHPVMRRHVRAVSCVGGAICGAALPVRRRCP